MRLRKLNTATVSKTDDRFFVKVCQICHEMPSVFVRSFFSLMARKKRPCRTAVLRMPNGVVLPTVERRATGNRKAGLRVGEEHEEVVQPEVAELVRSSLRAISSDSLEGGDGSAVCVST